MMKNIIFTSVLVLAGAISGEAMAAPPCPAAGYTAVTTAANLNTLLSNTTICATATVGGEKWHEYNGTISGGSTGSADFEKIGSGLAPGSDPVDPNVVAGTWTISASSITYAYSGAGGTYNYNVFANNAGAGPGVELCTTDNTTQIATGTLAAGKDTNPANCP